MRRVKENWGQTTNFSSRLFIQIFGALEMTDEKIALHLAKVGKDDRDQFWRMLHAGAEQQVRDTKQPKGRHGGGGGSA